MDHPRHAGNILFFLDEEVVYEDHPRHAGNINQR